VDTLQLTRTEIDEIDLLLDEFEGEYPQLDHRLLGRATILAHRLPGRVRQHLNDFRLERMSGVCRIAGYPVDQERVGETPHHWRERPLRSSAHREELLLLLYGSLIGDPFAWATQQDGRLVHDIVPIKGHENEQLGSSSESLLTWHTEDAFHPLRGDFLSFACLRNPDRVPTTVGYVDELDLTEGTREILFQDRFGIRPDESHLAKNNSAPELAGFDTINEMQERPAPVAVLFGDPAQPYVRADPYFMIVDADDHEAQAALDEFVKAMDGAMFDIALEAGDFCFIDNFRVVHGRKPFTPRHDGTDRWLKRVNLTTDLRKSRSARPDKALHLIS
jgi:Fe(II)/alpha-ketoglutarate-dependent arginine beta-hydroxylase